MKKIIFVTESLVTMGGVVRVITNWSNYFIKKGYEVENVSVKEGKPFFDLDNRVKFTIVKFKFKFKLLKIFDIIPNTFKMYLFLKSRIHTNIIFNKSLYIEPIWILRKLGLFKNINLIYMHHGGSHDFRKFYIGRFWTRHRVKMIFDSFDKVVCLYNNEENYPTQVNLNKLFFIANPVSFVGNNVVFEKKENILLFLGRVTYKKGIDTLLYAWEYAHKYLPEWKLEIVGEGEDKNKAISLAKKLKLKNIEFINGTNNTKPFFERSKIFIMPSTAEGMPMTIIEAMACKCCVVSSKTQGGKKLVKDKKNGFLFDIGKTKELYSLILDIAKNEQMMKKISDTGYESISEYNIDVVVKKWNEILVY
ncbi:glycosyltransferase [Campylobacter suis]|uniref:GalNAc-alpha-(1->4)-GalNAc-alpha-(1->3)-diNAcBac-PP-undecaprenol alpha-1,4-N-acetyl-D-galactosaminyltransferase n=1 Tax=Campylobacter suis TaxID=2790657 RepID=A0ABM8Q3I0_9BACT|nr:glycosyltransferase [Campylobacter suis]CAD7287299.1 GalNAc-alpha-(1->4)-GalNAc-alpha-(1->3)-diNAcBac-PP-undecaprenol alpha-1,4-N-acetyl-D-galactosaminyltransferase [Campylobacter suis]